MRRSGNAVAWLPVIHDDLTSQHIEYVPRIVRRRTLRQRVLLALTVGLAASVVLYALAFVIANPDSFRLSPEARATRRTWLRAISLVDTALAFAAAAYWQWPRRRRDRDGVPMPVATRDHIALLRHRRQLTTP